MKKAQTMVGPPVDSKPLNLSRGYNLRVFLLIVWTVLLTGITFFLGGVPMRGLRKLLGSTSFWGVHVLLCVSFFTLGWTPLAIALTVLTVLIGVYAELEDRKYPVLGCGFGAILGSVSVSLLIYLQWSKNLSQGWMTLASDFLTKQLALLENIKLIDSKQPNMDMAGLVNQIPSMFVVLILITLALSLVFDGRMRQWVKVPFDRLEKLSNFRLPDFCVWFLIASLFGSFFNHGIGILNAIAANVLNIILLLYFFQGLAIAYSYFDYFAVKMFWRVIWIILFINQMFVVMSFVGFVDFWVNFRQRLTPKVSKVLK